MSRVDVVKAFVKYASEVSRGEYFVKRGAVNWATFPFDEKGKAIAVMIDDTTFMAPNKGFDFMNLSLEVADRMPDGTQPAIDDNLYEQMRVDIEWILARVIQETNSKGDNVIMRVDRNARLIEFHDVDRRVQGVVVTLNLTF